MKEFFPVLHTAALFSGISDGELTAMLSCLGARIGTFPKGSRLLRAGESVEEVGLVLAGSALIVQEDIWGNRNILSKAGPGQTFAEVFACAPGSVLNVSVVAESAVTVMFLRVRRVLSVCPSACSHHSRIIRNLLTRAKLMSYFSAEAQRRGGYEFDIPFSRQQLAELGSLVVGFGICGISGLWIMLAEQLPSLQKSVEAMNAGAEKILPVEMHLEHL